MEVENLKLGAVKKYKRNAKDHPEKQVEMLCRSIQEFGFNSPILIDANSVIIAGHGRFEAAKRLKLETVPCVRIEHLTEKQVAAYRLADNKISEFGEVNMDFLSEELSFLDLNGFDMDSLGFGKDQPIDFSMDDGEFSSDGVGSGGSKSKTCPKCGFAL